MNVSIILSVVALGVALGSSYYFWKRISQMESSFDHLSKEISDVVIDSRLSNAFADGSLRNLDKIARQVFEKAKTKFNMESESYSEMATEIKSININKDLRKLLSGFFSQMIQVSYRGQNLSKDEVSDLQKKIKTIIKALQKH